MVVLISRTAASLISKKKKEKNPEYIGNGWDLLVNYMLLLPIVVENTEITIVIPYHLLVAAWYTSDSPKKIFSVVYDNLLVDQNKLRGSTCIQFSINCVSYYIIY